jgi:20S proteasome alpha/beta subunit
VTYQVTLLGRDGVVLASDRREVFEGTEGTGQAFNMIRKITLDPSGRYAWQFSGGEVGRVASSYLRQRFEEGLPDDQVEDAIRNVGPLAWGDVARGPQFSFLVLAHGPSRKILRSQVLPGPDVREIMEPKCITGQTNSLASFIIERFFAPSMSVEELAALATYAVRQASELNPMQIDGLDVAIYRDSTGRFELSDSDAYWRRASEIDSAVRASVTAAIRA